MVKVSSKARFFGLACLFLGAMFAFCACSGSVSLEWQLDNLGDSIVGIHTDLQTQFLSSKNLKLPTDVKGIEELSRPAPVHIEWSAESDGKEVTIQKYLLELSLDSRFNKSVVYETVEPEFDVYNLLLDA
ncbi:MAG: hypothetical protein K2G44_00005, partial [Clostridia bacterium]|nr:hypothetical protein [Clostridia bacterium]